MADISGILEKFRNGEERYGQDGVFTSAVDSLKLGIGVYAVLDSTLRGYSRLSGLLEYTSTDNKRLTDELKTLKAENQRLTDEVASYKDALKLSRKV